MAEEKKPIYRILYDGDCPLCQVVVDKIDHSAQQETFEKINIVTETIPNHLTQKEVMKEIHVLDESGNTYKGADAILKIIEQYPRFAFLTKIGKLPVIHTLLGFFYKIVAKYRRFIFGSISKAFWFKTILILTTITTILLSVKLWVSTRIYPLTPVLSALPSIPYPWDYVVLGALLLSLIGVLLSTKPRIYIASSLIIFSALVLLDQSRMQPQFYEFFFLLCALVCFSWNTKDTTGQDKVLRTTAFIFASVYIWSGIQKINLIFMTGVFPWMLEPILKFLPRALDDTVLSLGILIPFIEILIGVGLCIKNFRRPAVICAIGLHLFVLYVIGPFGHNWNSVVWPWNIFMCIVIPLIFWKNKDRAADILWNKGFPFHIIIFIIFGIMPLFNFLGHFIHWDSYPSFTLYSGNTNIAHIYMSDEAATKLPTEIRKYITPLSTSSQITNGATETVDKKYKLDIRDWSIGELNTTVYPESRIFKQVMQSVCAQSAYDPSIELHINEDQVLVSPRKISHTYTCSK